MSVEMNNNNPPSIFKIIQTDYYTFLAILFLLILWSFFVLSQLFDLANPNGSVYIVLALSALSAGVILWRYQSIHMLFLNGLDVPGIVTEIWFYRGRGRINYTYHYRGHEYLSGDDIMPTAESRSIRNGDRITILMDANNPNRTIVKGLYQ